MILDETFLITGAEAPMTTVDRVRIGAFLERSTVAGPGIRAVLWVAGCLRRCPQCMKPDLFSFTAGCWAAVEELAERILAIPGLTGVTYSGGEPFEQAAPLAALSERLRPHGLTTAVYSGYQLSALREVDRFRPLLEQLDLLIDGEYRHDLPGPLKWRGSENQAIYDFASGAPVRLEDSSFVREMQLSLNGTGLRITGFPTNALLAELAASLTRRGLEMLPAESHP